VEDYCLGDTIMGYVVAFIFIIMAFFFGWTKSLYDILSMMIGGIIGMLIGHFIVNLKIWHER